MTCSKWEETGLLFSSGELSENETAGYREHIGVCSECAGEYNAYMRDKRQFFAPDILGGVPSAKCDAEIIRVCSDGRKKVVHLHPFSLMFKRTLVSLALLVAGFTSVTYVTVRMGNTEGTQMVKSVSSPLIDSLAGVSHDSTTDTTPINNVNFAKTRGNLELKGVYPVDLQNK